MSTNSELASQPDDEPRRSTKRAAEPERSRVNQDYLRDLVNALGDPNHALHSQSVNDLVDLGPAAVPALSAALAPTYPWLTSYRAAEALAQIGDGRASGALINALRHPNSNVRWSVVRALSEIGDTRSLLALRRVVQTDHGKTSWGESVADTAQLALDRLQSRSAVLRFSEPIKTALVFVAMLAVLAFASSRVQALRAELGRSDAPPPVVAAAPAPNETAQSEPTDASPVAESEPTVTTGPASSASAGTLGTVTTNANIRNGPSGRVIGGVKAGDQIILIAQSGEWYRVRLGERVDGASRIDGGEGYISKSLVSELSGSVPTADATATP